MEEVKQTQKPSIKEYGWTVYWPLSKQHKRYEKEYEKYETSSLSNDEYNIYSLKKQQSNLINQANLIFIFLVTLAWGILPHLFVLPSFLNWMNLGMHSSNRSWIENIGLFILPGGIGLLGHHLPKIIPNRNTRLILDCFLKIIPFLLVIIWFIKTQILINRHKLNQKMIQKQNAINIKNSYKEFKTELKTQKKLKKEIKKDNEIKEIMQEGGE